MRGVKPLLEQVDVTLNPGDKIGLIGANGAGKSSLFAMMRGELHPDQGEIDFPAKWRVAYVAQETPPLERCALDYAIDGDVAVHRSATVEPGAVLKGPLVVGPGCFIAAGAYLRGGNWLDARCSIGPGAELKSSFVFAGTALAHFNFVGDSVLGAGVNLEAGSIVCNHRNERAAKEILVRGADGALRPTGCEKFGALVGDGARIGANA
eukprot:gene34388-38873_t